MILDGQDYDLDGDSKLQPGSASSTIRKGELATEVTVSVKDEFCKVIEKDIYYGELTLSEKNGFLNHMIIQALIKIGAHPDKESPEIIVKTKTIWQS
jgi:hypothetical protein